MKISERYSILLHIIGWALFFSVPFLAMPESRMIEKAQTSFFIVPMMINNAFLLGFFYLNLNYLVPNLLFKKYAAFYLLGIFIGFVGLVVLNIGIINLFVIPKMSIIPPPPDMPKPPFPHEIPVNANESVFPRMLGPVISFALVVLMGTLLAFVRERIRSKEEKQLIEIEKTAAELAVLKLQISPHFLFNTLNNIRWLARQKSDKTEDAVVKLSTLLRYILYQATEERVSLMQEIRNLEDYISLQKMRISDRINVVFSYGGDVEAHQIEPLLFIPFVENAFKYGIHGQQISEILIKLNVDNDRLVFSTENTVFGETNVSNDDSGIGIMNVQKRLEMYYPNRYELLYYKQNGRFYIKMNIDLKTRTSE